MQKISGKQFLHPRYWLTWFGLGFLWLLVQLPWGVQMWLGKQFGLLMFYLLPKRREICCINLELAFPERTAAERAQLNREHFISLGRGLLETALSWWGDDDKLAQQTDIEGLENLHDQLAKRHCSLLLCGLNSQPLSLMTRSGFVDLLGKSSVFIDLEDALAHARRALEATAQPR